MFFDQKLRDKSKTIKVNRQRLKASIRAERLRARILNVRITELLQKEDFGSAKILNNERIRTNSRADSLSKVDIELVAYQRALGLAIQKYTDAYDQYRYYDTFNAQELEALAVSESSAILAKELLK